MNGDKIALFMKLAGQAVQSRLQVGTPAERALGARLLLSEVLEYIIHGLGVTPEFAGTRITAPDALTYHATGEADHTEVVDGLADVAYTMFWNACAFGVPLSEAFDLVCENNLEKFVKIPLWTRGECELARDEWHCGCAVNWPEEVTRVEVVLVNESYYAVGKDSHGKVRKPSTYRPVDLSGLLGR
jgi:hypothetical protein